MTQIAIPVDVSSQEVAREKTLGGAIALCVKAAGHEPKDLQLTFKWDKAQWSRWESGQEGIVWSKLAQLMDYCGNDAPLLWMLHARGYEIGGLRKRESETERELRLTKERLAAVEAANVVLVNAMNGRSFA